MRIDLRVNLLRRPCSCNLGLEIFKHVWEKECDEIRQSRDAILAAQEQINAANSKLEHIQHPGEESQAELDAAAVLRQYKEHRKFFHLARRKMKPSKECSKRYTEALSRLKLALHSMNRGKKFESIPAIYDSLWEAIYDFFTSNEYLGNLNPAFLQTTNRTERDGMVSRLFEIKPLDVDLEFYRVMIHVMQEQILQEKYDHLATMQKLLRIQRRYRVFREKATERAAGLVQT